MDTSQAAMQRLAMATVVAASLAIPAEGIYTRVYKDPGGIDTYCIGETENPDKTREYKLEECLAKLNVSMGKAVLKVDKCQPRLPFGVLVAFSDAVYNMGSTIACNTQESTAARYLKAMQYKEACDQLLRWNKAKVMGVYIPLPGLTSRREAEHKVCLKALM